MSIRIPSLAIWMPLGRAGLGCPWLRNRRSSIRNLILPLSCVSWLRTRCPFPGIWMPLGRAGVLPVVDNSTIFERTSTVVWRFPRQRTPGHGIWTPPAFSPIQ